ncbi:forkhead box protein R1 isoform X2 [Phyllopteryx taeniolatus]|uniref:forkhead box protein R1 isoform X2 n=1 Tax=Phyllopteryx taeniolatus TaxID=161469 RepID=UPI002AD553C5|nr:forkhead box protein R1 isoform X2 [Phyllopteryx taeniolatus]
MTLKLQTQARLFDLHCSVGLTDWDMDKELKLVTTTDQFCHDDKLGDPYVAQRSLAIACRRKDEFVWYDKTSDTFVKPNLWLLVNPNIACPLLSGEAAVDCRNLQELAEEVQKPLTQCSQATKCHRFSPQGESVHVLSSSTDYMDDGSSCQTTHCRRKGRNTKDNELLKPGCWPRPPVNYCILIALALKSSHNGSLRVQQIYNFTREHFPFFQTAPDGWKNTIRHNLCFNSSFRKTCNQMRRDGKRKSCFWHLTRDGQRRLKDEICMLSGESLKQLERSMSCPGECDQTTVCKRFGLAKQLGQREDVIINLRFLLQILLQNYLECDCN